MIDTSHLIELAERYVTLSNDHRVDSILPLFAAGALYRSRHVGEFHGRVEIGDMMRTFFADYPDAHWQVDAYEPGTSGTIEFDFRLTATHGTEDSRLIRTGRERIRFNTEGLIEELIVD